MNIRPFDALRPPPGEAAEIAAPPYDVIDTTEARRYAEGNPKCFLRISKPEIGLPPETDAAGDAVYAQGARTLALFRERGWLAPHGVPALYLYRQAAGGHTQYGLVCCCPAADYGTVIRKHEFTLRSKELDRTRHIATTGIHSGPVLLTYRDTAELDALAARAHEGPPLYEVESAGVRHALWLIENPAPWVEAFRAVPCAYVADGHHRAAAAVQVARDRAAADPGAGPEAEHQHFLAVLFPARQLRILAYNRVVAELNGLDPAAFLSALRQRFDVKENAAPAPPAKGHASLYLAGRWYGLAWPEPRTDDPVERLDAHVLQHRLLAPVLGIDDPRTDPRIRFVGGIHGAGALERAVDQDGMAAAFSLYPVSVEDLMQVADAGRVMPPKSTWFEPKLLSGLVVHPLD